MSHKSDLSFLDKREILEIMFPIVHSSGILKLPPEEAKNIASHFIEVEKGIKNT